MATPFQAALNAVRLDRLSEPDLALLLTSEQRAWRTRLWWDASDLISATLSGVKSGTVTGGAVLCGLRPVGYLTVHPLAEPARLGSIHLTAAAPSGTAALLVDVALEESGLDGPGLYDSGAGESGGDDDGEFTDRVEGQLMALDGQGELDAALARRGFTIEPRSYLVMELTRPRLVSVRALPEGLTAAPLVREPTGAVAEALVAAHAGTVEAEMNWAFQDAPAAAAYLEEIAHGWGCGRLLPEASLVIRQDSECVGFTLVTSIASRVAHLVQLAVVPAWQGCGAGAYLLQAVQSLLLRAGYLKLTLAVSRANLRARALYARAGFREALAFSAQARGG